MKFKNNYNYCYLFIFTLIVFPLLLKKMKLVYLNIEKK